MEGRREKSARSHPYGVASPSCFAATVFACSAATVSASICRAESSAEGCESKRILMCKPLEYGAVFLCGQTLTEARSIFMFAPLERAVSRTEGSLSASVRGVGCARFSCRRAL